MKIELILFFKILFCFILTFPQICLLLVGPGTEQKNLYGPGTRDFQSPRNPVPSNNQINQLLSTLNIPSNIKTSTSPFSFWNSSIYPHPLKIKYPCFFLFNGAKQCYIDINVARFFSLLLHSGIQQIYEYKTNQDNRNTFREQNWL